MRTGALWEISVPTTQFCCEPKTVLKNKISFFFYSCIAQASTFGSPLTLRHSPWVIASTTLREFILHPEARVTIQNEIKIWFCDI